MRIDRYGIFRGAQPGEAGISHPGLASLLLNRSGIHYFSTLSLAAADGSLPRLDRSLGYLTVAIHAGGVPGVADSRSQGRGGLVRWRTTDEEKTSRGHKGMVERGQRMGIIGGGANRK